jgi:hypothetical protein
VPASQRLFFVFCDSYSLRIACLTEKPEVKEHMVCMSHTILEEEEEEEEEGEEQEKMVFST